MNRFYRNALGATLALSLASAQVALAQQDQGHQDDHATPAHSDSHMNGPVSGHVETNKPGYMQSSNHMQPTAPAHQEMVMQNSHPASRSWRHGDRYTGSRHVVSNYSAYHLQHPPSGYEWVQSGNQFVLIAVTSGIIASVLAASH
jgi:Ni/Co efflux regulator RcnB